ncbi:MAG: autotransporter domain-containing protein [Alphaproteobacteria bacterium]|nr:autotransporter domain-containing protein [Alphaproteobacteria bacterium]
MMGRRALNKSRLLSRVSTLALLASVGSIGAAQASCLTVVPGTITGTHDCAEANSVVGNVTNNATIGPPGDGEAGFFVGKGGITGSLLNNGVIAGGGESYYDGFLGALTIATNVSGGVTNTGIISSASGNGIQLGTSTSESYTSASMTGSITNSGAITATLGDGIAAILGSMTGGLLNEDDSTISGGDRGVYIADDFTGWGGGITNAGEIQGVSSGIQIGDIGGEGGGEGSVAFSGGIHNQSGASINSLDGPSIAVGGASFDDGIWNSGTITQRSLEAAGGEGSYAGIGILITAETFNGGISNGGLIEGLGATAILISDYTSDFIGGITNNGTIAGVDDGIAIESGNFDGGMQNNGSGQITASSENGNGVYVTSNWTGDLNNSGVIQGGSSSGIGIYFDDATFAGNVSNSGSISGGYAGFFFEGEGSVFKGPSEGTAEFVNTNSISGRSFGVFIRAEYADANFSNVYSNTLFPPVPTISGGSAGVVLAAGNWNGNISNAGLIDGGVVGLLVGGIINPGSIGGTTIERVTNSFTGTIDNSGLITGSTVGLFVTADSVSGDFTNSGTIAGGITGVYISAGTFDGEIVNDGVISGGVGFSGLVLDDPGLSIVTGTHTGNIINNGTLDAASSALILDIGTLNGSVTNTGLIEATIIGQTAVNLLIDNGTTFTNTGGGVIQGDVFFGGKSSAYQFIGEGGGVEGDLIGVPVFYTGNDDSIVVQNGTQYFIAHGGTGTGSASNFASFDIDSGGVAVMGSNSFGSTGGNGYDLVNVGDLNLNAGGHLYVDNQSTLNAVNFTQTAGSTLSFFLGEPGVPIATAGTHYGQIITTGDVFLAGTLQAVLDPTAFSGTNITQFEYNDVIISGSPITTDFDDELIYNGSLFFQLSHLIDSDNTVDLRLTHVDFDGLADLGAVTVETAGPWKSMVNDRLNGLGAAGCNLAGSGGCLNRFAANESGATQTMTDATPGADPFEWLRTGTRRVGETAAWGRMVGVWGGTDGEDGVGGMNFNLAGGIVGMDHVFTPVLLAGVALQFTTDDIDFADGPDNADIDSFEVGTYVAWGDTRLYLNASASFIWHDFGVRRFLPDGAAFGSYNGTTYSAYAEAGKIFETEDWRIQPLVGLSFAHLETDAYNESGSSALLLSVDDAEFTSLKSMIGARFAHPIELESGRKLVPEARAIWAHEYADDHSQFDAVLQGFGPIHVEGQKYARDSLILGAGITVPLSDEASIAIDYDAGLNTDIVTHTLSAGFRLKW